jgi:hypothetical protein
MNAVGYSKRRNDLSRSTLLWAGLIAAAIVATPAMAREHHAASRRVVLSTSALAFERGLPGIAPGSYSSRFASHDGEFDYRRYWPYHAYYDYCAAHVADSGNGC